MSVLAAGTHNRSAEVGLIGNEGMTGLTVVLGGGRSPNATYVQIEGRALRISARELRKAMAQSASMHALFLKYAQTFLIQTSQAAAANGRARIDARLARWILMAHDRIGRNSLPLTHRLLAVMLGVRRASVTETVNRLAGEGLIRAARGEIVVLDRRGIEQRAGGYYGIPEAEYRRLIGS